MSIEQTSTIDLLPGDSAIEPDHPMTGFFVIGVVINLILIAAFFVWARKQWKKNKHEERG